MLEARARISTFVACILGVYLTLTGGHAGAQEVDAPSAGDRAAAESLFNEALALLEKGEPRDACPKLEASQRLDPGVGTLLYLADCYQQMGLTASAWATFREAAYLAKGQGQTDREQIAVEHAAALEDKLSYLTLARPEGAARDVEVRHNGEVVHPARLGTRFPVDPGSHTVEASGPGKKSWSRTIKVAEGMGQLEVVVPVLEPAPIEPALAPPATAPAVADGWNGRATLGWSLLGTGAAAVVTSGVVALLARADDADANAECRPDDQSLCNRAGVDLGDSAETKATIAGITGGVGLAALGAGLAVLLLAPNGDDAADSAVEVGARPLRGGGLVSVGARF